MRKKPHISGLLLEDIASDLAGVVDVLALVGMNGRDHADALGLARNVVAKAGGRLATIARRMLNR